AVLAGLAAAAAAAALVWVLVPGQYVAGANFEVRAGWEADDGGPVLRQKLHTSLVTSDAMVAKALAEPGVSAVAAGWTVPQMIKGLKAEFHGPIVMRVTLAGDGGEAVARALNALADVYTRPLQVQDEARLRDLIVQQRKRFEAFATQN